MPLNHPEFGGSVALDEAVHAVSGIVVVVMRKRLFAVSFACAIVGVDAPSQSTAIGATLEIADTEQFCPTTWRLRIDVPRDHEAILAPVPFVLLERKEVDGTWTGAARPPRGATDPDPGTSIRLDDGDASCGGSAAPQWKVAPGGTASFVGEIADWRVIGYPGTYRARCPGAFGGGAPPADVVSGEFSVREAGADGVILVKAQLDRDEVWTAYKQLMNGKLRIRVPSSTRLGEPPAYGAAMVRTLFEQPSAPWNVLRRASALPVTVRDRIDAVCLGPAQTLAWNAPAADRPGEVALVIAECKRLGTKQGFVGAFARLQCLVFTRAYGTAAELVAALTVARSDQPLLEVARGFPRAMQEAALFVDELGFPAQSVGPGSPRLEK